MEQKYSIDDILDDIKRSREQRRLQEQKEKEERAATFNLEAVFSEEDVKILTGEKEEPVIPIKEKTPPPEPAPAAVREPAVRPESSAGEEIIQPRRRRSTRANLWAAYAQATEKGGTELVIPEEEPEDAPAPHAFVHAAADRVPRRERRREPFSAEPFRGEKTEQADAAATQAFSGVSADTGPRRERFREPSATETIREEKKEQADVHIKEAPVHAGEDRQPAREKRRELSRKDRPAEEKKPPAEEPEKIRIYTPQKNERLKIFSPRQKENAGIVADADRTEIFTPAAPAMEEPAVPEKPADDYSLIFRDLDAEEEEAIENLLGDMYRPDKGEDEVIPPVFSFGNINIEEGLEIKEEPEEKENIREKAAAEEPGDVIRDRQQARNLRSGYLSERVGALITTALSFILFLGLLYLELAVYLPLPVPSVISLTDNRLIHIAVQTVLFLVIAVLNISCVGRGLLALFRLRATNESAAAFLVVAGLIQAIVLMLIPDASANIYLSAAALPLVFLGIGRMVRLRRIEQNLAILCTDSPKHAVLRIKNRELSEAASEDGDPAKVFAGVECEELEGFIRHSFSESYIENISAIVTPITVAATLVASVLVYVFSKDLPAAASSFAALCCICAPLTATLTGHVPLGRAAKKLSRKGVMISGFDTVETLCSADAVMISEKTLFPGDSVTLHGIKAFSKARIDEAIVDAASLVCAADSCLSDVFLNVIGHRTDLLKKAEDITFTQKGISALIEGRKVAIGSRQFLTENGMEVPSEDYEARYREDGKDVLYLGRDSEMSAMFLIGYTRDEGVAKLLGMLARKDIGIALITSDPNITPQKLEEMYRYPSELITVVPADIMPDIAEAAAPRKSAEALAVYSGEERNSLTAVSACFALKKAIVGGSMIQLIGTVLGYSVVCFFAVLGSLVNITSPVIIACQLVWTVMTLLFSRLGRV